MRAHGGGPVLRALLAAPAAGEHIEPLSDARGGVYPRPARTSKHGSQAAPGPCGPCGSAADRVYV